MKHFIVVTIIFIVAISTPVMALPQYSAETQKLLKDAGIEYNTPLDEVMSRQRDRQMRLNKKDISESANKNDITVNIPNGAKYSGDEFHTVPIDKAADDGYDNSTWGELHINSNYAANVYHPNPTGTRLKGFDELRYVDDLN